MNYGETKNLFLGILNRKDITPSLVNSFIALGIQKAQRVLRVPAMEKTAYYDIVSTEAVPIPNDLIRINRVRININQMKPRILRRADFNDVYELNRNISEAELYTRNGSNIILGPQPLPTTRVFIDYLADFSSLSADTDTNWMTQIAPDVVVYGGLVFAADYYLDDRAASWAEKYVSGVNELNALADDEELANARLGPTWDM